MTALGGVLCAGLLCGAMCAVLVNAATDAAVPVLGPARNYCRAEGTYHFQFPRDHFAHPCFRTEWWYFTGNLAGTDGRRFGFELTFFREGVDNPYPNPSRWRVEDLYLGHFALSDIGKKKFFYTERLNRAGIELAGADVAKRRIWNGDWSAELKGEAGSVAERERWRLEAAEGGHRIELMLRPLKPLALEGDKGLSQKAAGTGNASYYYSLTRMDSAGRISIDGRDYAVTGLAWMDHEFFTNSMEKSQIGWNWVSLQMDDGTEWMLYQFRRTDGKPDPFSSGTLVDREGRTTHLDASDFEMQPLNTWRSPHSGASYPVAWRIRVPRLGLDTEISAAMADQELVSGTNSGLTYWEGSVTAQGKNGSAGVTGRGYLEMTGYAGALSPALGAR